VASPTEDSDFIVSKSDKLLACSCSYSSLSGLPCCHELFICRKLGLDWQTSLTVKSRWYKKYESAMQEKLYCTDPDKAGVMTLHM